MLSFARRDSRDQGLAGQIRVALALGLMAVAPLAFGQKMYKCSDGKGGSAFQQTPCSETPQEAEARAKEAERLKAEQARKQEEEVRKKAEGLAKAQERDKAYQQQMEERAEQAKKAQEAEKAILEGTGKEKSDGSLTADMEKQYPGPWRTAVHPDLTAALAKAQVKDCGKFRYRQRVGGGSGEFLVQCSADGANWVAQCFVWLATGTVRGPYKL